MSVRTIIRSSALLHWCLLACSALVQRAAAQSTTSLQTDATVLGRHSFDVRVLTSFTRFDALVGQGGTRNIAASFTADTVDDRQITQLSFTRSAIQTLTGNAAFRVNAGTMVASADSRVVTAPLMVEYGVTKRLTVGIVIPLVETRSTVGAQLNPTLGTANVGVNPGAANWTTNAALVTSMRSAATALQARLAQCKTTPSGTNCSTILSEQTAVQALIDATPPFTSSLEGLYGTSASQPGVFFVPLDNSQAQTAINAAINARAAAFTRYGGTVTAGQLLGASGPAARLGMQAILALSGYDTLQSPDRSSIGDISIGATYQLANTFGDSARLAAGDLLYRMSVNATYRIGTGEPAQRNTLFDNATGYGQPGVIVGGAIDTRITRRFFLSALGSFTKQLASVDVSRAANRENAVFPLTAQNPTTYSAGDVVELTIAPRYRMAGLFSIDGYYALTRIGADSYGVVPAECGVASTPPLACPAAGGPDAGATAATTQQIGIGVSYSASLNDRGPGRIPYEASYRHTELISASGGPVPKTFQDRIQLRVFFR